mmetsp:Transcript_33359/g.65585  ORF Transcript_33359/g.65585 Transcript_33359/m.65585 type:complete len:206 (+) Transcript_33359:704-1321(+)
MTALEISLGFLFLLSLPSSFELHLLLFPFKSFEPFAGLHSPNSPLNQNRSCFFTLSKRSCLTFSKCHRFDSLHGKSSSERRLNLERYCLQPSLFFFNAHKDLSLFCFHFGLRLSSLRVFPPLSLSTEPSHKLASQKTSHVRLRSNDQLLVFLCSNQHNLGGSCKRGKDCGCLRIGSNFCLKGLLLLFYCLIALLLFGFSLPSQLL